MSLRSTVPPSDAARLDRYLAFAFAASDLLVEVRADGTIAFAAGAFNARFGKSPESFVGQHLRQLFHPADHGAVDMAMFITGLRGRLPPLILRLADLEGLSVALSGLALPSAGGRMSFTLGRLASHPASLVESPVVDFRRMLEQRAHGQDGGVLSLLELANWPELRSSISAEAYQVLQTEITTTLADLAGPGAMAGEIAEGRFGVISDHPSDLQAVARHVEQVLQASNTLNIPAQVTSSAMTLDRNGLTATQAARALRFALARYAAGGVQATEAAGFGDSFAGFMNRTAADAKYMRETIAGGRFRLLYQPIVDLTTLQVHHYEALIRPNFQTGSPIQNPQDFVTFAEAVGLSEELDLAVAGQALVAAANSPHVSVAVNVSGLSMQSVAFRRTMLGLLERSTDTTGRILVELTETADIEDVASAAESVAILRRANVSFCIDDFGAGSASFRYLREFEVDYIKLDGAYVRAALHNAREHGFLLSMVELANLVGAKVIAEMIESEAQAKLMREIGVGYGQGWLFGRPGSLPGPRRNDKATGSITA